MHTAPELTSAAAAHSAHSEASTWLEIARAWSARDHPAVWCDVPGAEASVVGLYDPRDDLLGRMKAWGYPSEALDLADLARFAAGLAQAEAEAWTDDRAHVATQAYADRRFLLGDRILHWAVPWLEMVSRWYPESADQAHESRRQLLELGDRHRPAPAMSGTEGLVVPGFDGLGPLDSGVTLAELMLSVWSGVVLSIPQLSEMRHTRLIQRVVEPQWLHDTKISGHLGSAYRDAARGWDRLTTDHPGSSQLWRDLGHRARQTAARLSA